MKKQKSIINEKSISELVNVSWVSNLKDLPSEAFIVSNELFDCIPTDIIKYVDNDETLDFFSVQNSNYCKIKIFNHHSEDKIIIVSAIDNLIKGAAGQAVQCFNIAENIEETVSLV